MNQSFLENLTSAAQFRLIDLFLVMTVYLPARHSHTAQEPGSLFWCHAVMSLQFTHVRSLACGGSLPNLRADCFTVIPYCVAITWQQIF